MPHTIYEARAKAERMNNLMVTLDQTISAYYKKEGRFPCPAPLDGAAAGNDYDAETCVPGAVLNVAGTGGGRVLIGKVPAATLGLSNDYMRDIYGSYMTYAVSRDATQANGSIQGTIRVKEENVDRAVGSATFGEIVELEDHANITYLVQSFGPTRVGAFAHDGTQSPACSSTSKDKENCNGDGVFISSLLSNAGAADDPSYFDDRIVFKKDDDLETDTTVLKPAIRGKDYEINGDVVTMREGGFLQFDAGSFSGEGGPCGALTGCTQRSGVVLELAKGDVINLRQGSDSFLGSSGYDPATMSNPDGSVISFDRGPYAPYGKVLKNGTPVPAGEKNYVYSRPYESYSGNVLIKRSFVSGTGTGGYQRGGDANASLWVK